MDKSKTTMRRFLLQRDEDISGMSGTGVVAEGVEFSNGLVAMTWLSHFTSVVCYQNIKHAQTIHGHEGRTNVVWVD